MREHDASDQALWESYRLYQRDVLQQCFEDADMMLRRLRDPAYEKDRGLVVSLLWEKRCQPWKFYRDEQRALVRHDQRLADNGPTKARA